MSGPHNSADETALFVIDALDGEGRRRFEAHLEGCEACAERLAREAAAECTLGALWPSVGKPAATVLTLTLPLRVPALSAPATSVAPAPAAPRRALPTRAVNPRGASVHTAGNGLANALAAAVITVVFMGYFSDAARTGSNAGSGLARAGERITAGAFCALGDGGRDGRDGRDGFGESPMVLASRVELEDASADRPLGSAGLRMCLSDDGEPGLCREPARLCALP